MWEFEGEGDTLTPFPMPGSGQVWGFEGVGGHTDPCPLCQALSGCRHTLGALCQERGQVLELLGQPLRMVLLEAERDSWLSLSRPSSPFVMRNPTPEASPVGPYTPGMAWPAPPWGPPAALQEPPSAPVYPHLPPLIS